VKSAWEADSQAPPLLTWDVVRRGLHLLGQGHITDARQLLLHWEAQGAERDAAVALSLGTSYDPIELEQLRSAAASPNVVPDSFADIAMARTWYLKAKDLGSIEAERRLESLAALESQPRPSLGANHRDVGQAFYNLALVYADQRKYGEAEELYKRALAVREQALGASHPDVGQTLHNLALVYWTQGRYSEAEGLYKRALAIREKALGANHRDVGQTLNNLALVYLDQGKYAEAEVLFKRALAIRETALGANHRDVGETLNNLASARRLRR
jgi:tetratricopeptide (TPR) repeat protein